jgi:hypothetical protein
MFGYMNINITLTLNLIAFPAAVSPPWCLAGIRARVNQAGLILSLEEILLSGFTLEGGLIVLTFTL